MSIRNIHQYPDPVLRRKAAKIEEFGDELKALIADMAETMYEAPGIGLAAPQVGESVQVIVVNVGGQGERSHKAFINPEITASEGSQIDEEGCLSVPELTSNVQRFKRIELSYQDEEGCRQELSAEDRFAVVLQHEIDHLNGILFIDHLTPLKRNLYKKKMKKALASKKVVA